MTADQPVTVVEKVDGRWQLTPEAQQQEQHIHLFIQSEQHEQANQALATLRRAIGLTILDADHKQMGIGSPKGGILLVDWLQQMGSHEIVTVMERLRALARDNRQRWKHVCMSTGDWNPEDRANKARQHNKVSLAPYTVSSAKHLQEIWSEDKTAFALRDFDPFWDGSDSPGYESYEIWDLITLDCIEADGRYQREGPSISAMVREVAESGQIVDCYIW